MVATRDAEPALVGVDGCRFGWVAAAQNGGPVSLTVHESFDALLTMTVGKRDGLVVVDMPIGLPESDSRACDVATRAALPGGASSVFSAPLRCMLAAETYEAACERSRASHDRGLALSKQSWFLFPKIREVDVAARSPAHARTRFVETHPELVFRHWGGRRLASKKSSVGRAERRALVASLSENALAAVDELLATTRRKDVAVDDVYDALACLRVAGRIAGGAGEAVLDAAVRDTCGLEMNVWF